MIIKDKRRTSRAILVIGAVALLAVTLWLVVEIAELFGYYLFTSPKESAERFAERCDPQWDSAFEN